MLEVVRFVNSRFTSNTYIIAHPEHENVWVVDPGDTDAFFEWMKAHSKTTITGVLLTHTHFDHMYGINEVITHYPSVKVYVANEYGKEVLGDAKKNGSKYTDEGPIVVNQNAEIKFYDATILLWEGVELQTINTPGHSDDSVCIIIEGCLFTGDTLIKNIRTVTKLKSGSKEKLSQSLTLLEMEKGKGLVVYPGHDDIFTLDDYDLSISERIE